jgi:peptidoglycan hydrolase-like protein with peptidoglycan-binding domain
VPPATTRLAFAMRQHNDHPPESTGGSQRASLGPAGPGASQATWAVPDVRLVQRLQTAAGNAAVTDLLTHPPTVGLTLQRRPADVGATPALTLKSGWGFLAILATPWDHLQTALRDYASLKDDQYAARAAVLKRLPVLITDWELHHNVGTAQLNAEEKAKVAAIVTLRQLIADEKRELAVLAAGVDEATQAVKAGRFKGDPLLEQVMVGALTVGLGNSGLYVTKLQQALADMPYLAVDKVSGTFDADTQAAVKRFQRANALGETGTVDHATMSRLEGDFRGHAVEKQLAQAPKIGPKSSAGQFAWGSAPTQLGVGTRALGLDEQTAAKEAVKTAQVAGPAGVLPTFVNDVGSGTYESRLQTLVLGLVERQFNRLARGKAAERTKPDALFDWAHLDAVAARSKAATDAVFGKFATGPPLAHGVSIHDAWDTKVLELQDVSVQDTSATWRVNKLLTGNADVKALDREHGAIQGRGPEKAIVDRVRAAVIAAKRDKLLEIHKAWPAFASGGVVNIQRFKAATALANRDEMWKLFHTVVHEYLHTLEHSRYRAYQTKLGQQEGSFTLREGVVEYFTHTVLDGVAYDDPLRVAVEGPFHDPLTKHPIPPYGGYAERTNAEKLAGQVGARNVMAAFFLGDVEKIGGKG